MAGGRLAWGLGLAKRADAEPEALPSEERVLIANWPLQPHPSSKNGAIDGIAINVSRADHGRLIFDYMIEGEVSALVFPPTAITARADQLWRTSCCEAFVKPVSQDAYVEFNFSPSSRWAAYRFADYRDGMRSVATNNPPQIEFAADEDRAALRADVDLSAMATSLAEAALEVAVSAVIEERGGAKSFWALAHPPGKPDFHHADSFALRLAAPR